jgi:3-hydroxyacyl-[acyl-carrier-protein] dehydratase
MAGKEPIVDLSSTDLTQVYADIEEIRKYNPQRHEMEQLTAIIMLDEPTHICLGYKDISESEFWVRGHMPDFPLMPGVVMCEAAAQISSFYTQRLDLLGADMVGFGGLEEVHFRGMVRPGDRFYVCCQMLKVRRNRMIVAAFQGWVEDRLVVDGKIKGIPINSPS